MSSKKSLEIIKNNKRNQKKLEININTYKNYCETFSSIIIEMIPIPNLCGTFINIPKEEDKPYYHIYFNDNSDEIKRNYLNEKEKVNTIKLIIDYQVKSLKKLFFYCDNISSIKIFKIYRFNTFTFSK